MAQHKRQKQMGGGMELPVETEKPEKPKSPLSYTLLSTEPASAGCFSAPFWALLGGGASILLGGTFEQACSAALASALAGGWLTSGAWQDVLRLYKSGYTWLSGRRERDAHRLCAWAYQKGEPGSWQHVDGTSQLQVQPNPPRGLLEAKHNERLAEREWLDSLDYVVTLDVEPRPNGYVLWVRFQMPEVWQTLLSPCVSTESSTLGKWLAFPPVAGDEDLEIWPFSLQLLSECKDDEGIFTKGDAAIYVHCRELCKWLFDRAYWTDGGRTLNICKEVPLESLEHELSFYRELVLLTQQSLSRTYHPLFAQLLHELSTLQHNLNALFEPRALRGNRWRLPEQERNVTILNFWCLICSEYLDSEDTKDLFLQFLTSRAGVDLASLVRALPSAARDDVMLPLLRELLFGRWLRTRQLISRPVKGSLSLIDPHDRCHWRSFSSPFRTCLDVLEEHLSSDDFVGLCQSLCLFSFAPLAVFEESVLRWPQDDTTVACRALYQSLGEGAQVSGEPQSVKEELRKLCNSALEAWHAKEGDESKATLVRWLEELCASSKYELLTSLSQIGLTGDAIEDAVIGLLSWEPHYVTREHRAVRMAAIHFLDKRGSSQSISALQEAIQSLDESRHKSTVLQARQALKRLRDRHGLPEEIDPALQGGLSIAEEAVGEGQLSLAAGDTEGQLSLLGGEKSGEEH